MEYPFYLAPDEPSPGEVADLLCDLANSESFPEGVSRGVLLRAQTTIRSLSEFIENGCDESNVEALHESHLQDFGFEKIGSYWRLANLAIDQVPPEHVSYTDQPVWSAFLYPRKSSSMNYLRSLFTKGDLHLLCRALQISGEKKC